MNQVVNLAEKLAQFREQWTPHVVATLNDYHLKVVRLQGAFVWHQHAETDELFLVVSGNMEIRLRDEKQGETSVRLGAGDLYIVPRGVEHCPVAKAECQALLIEPAGTLNTGDTGGARTVLNPRQI